MRISLFDSIPCDIKKSIAGIKPASAEWLADDMNIFQGRRSYPEDPPLSLACSWLERLRTFWIQSIIRLVDGSVILFNTAGFLRLETKEFSYGNHYILYDEEQGNPKENSVVFLSSNRQDRPFPGTRWLPSGSVLLGPRLRIGNPSAPERLGALVALGVRQYMSLKSAEEMTDEVHALVSLLEEKVAVQGFSVRHVAWEQGKQGGGLGYEGTLGEWLMAETPALGFIYVEGEADLIEVAERSWLIASGRKDPYAREDAGLFQRQRQPGACVIEGGTI